MAIVFEGIRDKRFHILCDHVTSMEVSIFEDDTSQVLTIVTALLRIIIIIRGIQAILKRLNLIRKCRRLDRTLSAICRRL